MVGPCRFKRMTVSWIILWTVCCRYLLLRLDLVDAAFVGHVPTATTRSKTTTGSECNRGIPHSRAFVMTDWTLAATSSSKKKNKKNDGERPTQNHDQKWQPLYDALREYQQTHGHVNVVEDEALQKWLQEQRKSYKNLQMGRKTKLTRKRAQALELIPGAIPPDLLDNETI